MCCRPRTHPNARSTAATARYVSTWRRRLWLSAATSSSATAWSWCAVEVRRPRKCLWYCQTRRQVAAALPCPIGRAAEGLGAPASRTPARDRAFGLDVVVQPADIRDCIWVRPTVRRVDLPAAASGASRIIGFLLGNSSGRPQDVGHLRVLSVRGMQHG